MSGAVYANPFWGEQPIVGRTDQGVDVNLKPGQPIYAIGDARIIGITPNWYKRQPLLWYQLLSGPRTGQYVYVAEQITPTVKPGDRVRAGQPIGTYAPTGTGLEIGFATARGGVLTPYNASDYEQATPGGRAFRGFLDTLLTTNANPTFGKIAGGENLGHGGPIDFPGGIDTSGKTPKDVVADAAAAAVKTVLGGLWDSVKGDALKALLYVVFVVGGIVMAVYGLAKMLDADDLVRAGVRRAAKAGALAVPA